MKTLKAALAGRVLTHSISPEVHRAIFPIVRERTHSEFGAIEYNNLECETEDVFRFHIKHGGEWGFTGLNVTFPYKHIASQLARDADATVRSIHSGNTIRFGMQFRVCSTDGPGFRFALMKECPDLDTSTHRLVVVGAGGAARAVLHAVIDMGWRSITVAARSVEGMQRTFEDYPDIEYIELSQLERDEGPQCVVHATPVGQRSSDSLLYHFEWKQGDIAVDLIYNPLRTRFLDHAAEQGATPISGLGMLLEQAALSQHIWMTGQVAAGSMLSEEEYFLLKESLAPLLAPRWDAFVT
jgi:shikimate dehydrogenase